jgi:hypothetical protein
MVLEQSKDAVPNGTEPLPKLAFSVDETAAILGIHRNSVYSLLNRGLLKCSTALRHKIIPRSEIERFLNATLS